MDFINKLELLMQKATQPERDAIEDTIVTCSNYVREVAMDSFHNKRNSNEQLYQSCVAKLDQLNQFAVLYHVEPPFFAGDLQNREEVKAFLLEMVNQIFINRRK